MAVCTPVTVVPRSLATMAMDTFITELSSAMRNCPAASVRRTVPAPRSAPAGLAPTGPTLPSGAQTPTVAQAAS